MKKGFTLVEILAVIAVIAILSLLVLPNFVSTYNTSVDKAMKLQENQIVDATKMFIEDYCRNPVGENTGQCSSYSLNIKNSDNTKKYTCLNNIQSKKYIEDINLDGVSCKGFIVYDKEDNSKNYTNYKAYIQCSEGYQTEGIENIVDSTGTQIIEKCDGYEVEPTTPTQPDTPVTPTEPDTPIVPDEPELPEEKRNFYVAETGKYYETLSSAFDSVSNNQTIKLMKTIMERTTATLDNSKIGIKLDLNGYNLNVNVGRNVYLINNGELDIYNSSSTTSELSFDVVTSGGGIRNNGNLTLNKTNNAGKTYITYGEDLQVPENYLVYNDTSAIITIYNNGYVTTSMTSEINNKGTVIVDGGNISGIRYTNSGTTILNSGTIHSNETIYSNNLTIYGGKMDLRDSDMGMKSTGTLNILGGEVDSTRNGIYVSTGTITIGTNDGTVSTTEPKLYLLYNSSYSDYYGVKVDVNATFNWYDGKIYMRASSYGTLITRDPDNMPTGYVVNKENTNSYYLSR